MIFISPPGISGRAVSSRELPWIMRAGSASTVGRGDERLILEIFVKLFFVGEKPGLAQVAKLGNNLLAAAALAISSEALAMGVEAGLDPQVMIDIINAGSGRNSAGSGHSLMRDGNGPRALDPRWAEPAPPSSSARRSTATAEPFRALGAPRNFDPGPGISPASCRRSSS